MLTCRAPMPGPMTKLQRFGRQDVMANTGAKWHLRDLSFLQAPVRFR
jgi:hypothetical protein